MHTVTPAIVQDLSPSQRSELTKAQESARTALRQVYDLRTSLLCVGAGTLDCKAEIDWLGKVAERLIRVKRKLTDCDVNA